MAMASGHKVEVLEGQELERQMRDWSGYKEGLVRLTPGPWVFPKPFLNFADSYYNFQFRPSDVVIATYPKCGTTWAQEIVWTMRNNPDLDNPNGSLPINFKSPFLEMDMMLTEFVGSSLANKNPLMEMFHKMCPGRNPEDGMFLQLAECTSDPRTIKSHLSFSLLPPSLLDTCKVVYVARNPKDVLVSYHHHCRILNVHGFNGTWEDFVQYFVDDDLMYGAYAEHLKEAWEKRSHPNLHIIFFEDLKADVMGELKRLDTFLDTKLTPEQLDNVAQHTTFKKMKERENKMDESIVINIDGIKKDGGFFRKGEAGDWKNKFSPEVKAKVDAWIEKNINNIGVDFKYSV